MKYRRWFYGAKFWLMVLLFAAYSAVAVGIVMSDTAARDHRNLAQASPVKAGSGEQVRGGGRTQAGVCRVESGMSFSSLPTGSTFQVVWPDGSTGTMTIVGPSSQNGIMRVAGSPRKAPPAQ
ncbi:MAG: hypothetical protein QM581_00620 [Pseudomonas sp.]